MTASLVQRLKAHTDTASKHSIHTGAGVIDADYRGPVMVLLFNLGEEDFKGMLYATETLSRSREKQKLTRE